MELTLDQALQKGVEAHKAGKVQEADRYYTAILKANPKHPDANHNMGVLAVGVGKFEEALPFFKTALEVNPNVAQFWLSHIDALIKLDQIDDAKAVFDQAKSKGAQGDAFDKIEKTLGSSTSNNSNNQEPPQEKLQSLIKLYTHGQFQKTLDESSKLLGQFSRSVKLHNLSGAANASLGRLDAAIDSYSKALSIKPDYAEAYSNIGNTLQEQGKLEEAIEAFNKALAIKPNFAEAYYNMGIALQDQGKLEEAAEAYNNALTINPDYTDAYYNMGNALKEQGKLAEAIKAYTKALSIQPNNADAYYNMGVTLKDQGKLEEAIEAYTKVLFIKPDTDTYYNMGNALKEQGKLDEAVEAYNKAISIKPDCAEAYNNMGNALKEQGKLDEAIEAYNKALSIKPDYAEAYNNMGGTLQEQGMLDEAMQAYKKALSIKPDYAVTWSNGADALEKWNKLDQFELWLDKAFKSFDKVPADLRFMKSKLLWRSKKFEETSTLLSDIKLEAISENRRQDYLNLKAKCFEKHKSFEEAYKCFAKSNSLAKKSSEYLNCNPDNYFQKLKDRLDELRSISHKSSKAQSTENSDFAPIFLVGFPRSGTTLLDTILRSNSKIKVVEEQAMLSAAERFLNKNGHHDFVGKIIPKKRGIEARQIYFKEFNKHIEISLNDSAYVDKLPLNLLKAPLIHQMYPNAKFILVLRHPMDTILSCWMQNFKLNEAMANMVDLERIAEFYCIVMETFKICRTKYSLNVHEIRYEDLINNFEKESCDVVQFLNLQWEPEMQNYQDTALKRGRIDTPSYSQVVQPIYKESEYRWLNYREYLEKYIDKVKPWISEFGYD